MSLPCYFPEKLGETLYQFRLRRNDIKSQYGSGLTEPYCVLDKHLPWPGCELFLTGGLAALQVGPVARNLSGARMACDRIVPAIVQSSFALSPAIISQQSLVISDINSGCTVRDCWLLTVDCRRRGGKTQWLSVNCWLDFIIVMQPETIWGVISY